MINEKDEFDLQACHGDARLASAIIERWHKARGVRANDDDTVLGAMRDAIRTLHEAPRIRNDAVAAAIIDAMAKAQTMEAIMPALGRLDDWLGLRHHGKGVAAGPGRQSRAARMLLRL